ncbi:MAG: hypothetical protein R6V04_12480 [bacterium]
MRYKILVIIIVLIFCGQLFAQDEVLPIQRRKFVSIGSSFQIWKRETAPAVTQISLPFTYIYPVNDRLTFSIASRPAVSWWFGDYKVFGLSDTWVNTSWLLSDERLILNVGMAVPTGKTRLDENEFRVVTEGLTKNIYRFYLPNYGQGFSFRTGLVYSVPVTDNIVFGMGGQYLYNSSYTPVEYDIGDNNEPWEINYKPGDFASINMGLDFSLNDDMKLMFDCFYTYYFSDMLEDSLLYRAGGKTSLTAGYYYRFDDKYLWLFLQYRQRSKSKEMRNFRLDYLDSDHKFQFEVDMVLKPMEFTQGEMLLLANSRYYGKSEVLTTNDYLFGGGLGFIYEVSKYMKWDIRLKYLIGKVGGAGANGFEFSAILKYEF